MLISVTHAALYPISSWHLGLIECLWLQDGRGSHSFLCALPSKQLRNLFRCFCVCMRVCVRAHEVIYLPAPHRPGVLQCRQLTPSSSASAEWTMLQCSELTGQECDKQNGIAAEIIAFETARNVAETGWKQTICSQRLGMRSGGRSCWKTWNPGLFQANALCVFGASCKKSVKQTEFKEI